MTWLGIVIICFEGYAALKTAGDDTIRSVVRILTVVLAAALIVGILLVGTGHL